MTISAIAMTLMLLAGLTSFAVLMKPRTQLLLAAKPVDRLNQWPARAMSALKFAIGQWRMPREPIAGIAHILIFSGFMVVSVATIMHFVHAYAPGAHLPGIVGDLYSLIKDIFELLVVVGLVYALWRRLGPKETRVGRSAEGVFVLCMIMTLMLTDFLVTGGRAFASGATTTLPWAPGGYLGYLAVKSLSPETAGLVAEISYWVHCAAVLVFLNFLPLGKHFHVITGIPNVFFRDLEPYGRIKTDDVENAESFGIRTTADMDWSQVLNLYSCTECGRCTVYCPTELTGKPLSHRQLNKDLKAALYDDKEAILSGDAAKIDALPDLVGGKINPDTVWSCTTCGSCEQECPVFIENVPRIIEMRKHKTLMEGDISPELARAYKGMEQNNNPWGIGFDKRDAWAEGLEIPRMSDLDLSSNENPPILYWIGCAGSFDDRSQKITLAMTQILKAAKVPFAILGKEEGCTGDTAKRTGNEYLFQMLAQQNIETLAKYNIKNVLTHCPHCLHSLRKDYPALGGNYEVMHHSEMIEKLLKEGKLDLDDAGHREKIAWHDSCYLGRYNNIYEAPRNALKVLNNVDLVELPRNKSRSVCCGAGGGRFWVEEDIGERINVHRATEAVSAEPDTVGSSCPFCLVMMRDGVAHLEKDEDISTQDIAEIVAARLKGAQQATTAE